MIRPILEAQKKPMSLIDLENRVAERLKAEGLASFREVSGWLLMDFLTYNKDQFDVYNRKEKRLVKCRKMKKNDRVADIRTFAEGMQVLHTGEEYNETPQTDGAWFVAESKRSRNKLKPGLQGHDNEDSHIGQHDIPSYKNPESSRDKRTNVRRWSVDRIHSLMNAGENRNVLFVPQPEHYLNNDLLFSLDVVSMWNTPDRLKSHIVIGIEEERLIGVDDSFDEASLYCLFRNDVFSHKPDFECYCVKYQSLYLCVIEVGISRGHGSPSIATKSFKASKGLEINERQVWIRSDEGNVVCSHEALVDIYHWFSALHNTKTENDSYLANMERRHFDLSNNHQNTGHSFRHEDTANSNRDDNFSKGNTFEFFWNSAGRFQKGHFVLLVGNVICDKKYLSAFAEVPWICVYDFDIFSYTDGLLNAVHDSLAKDRHLSITTWNDTADNISEFGTRWCFMRGRREMNSSRTDQKDGGIEDANIWYKLVKRGVQNHCEKLAVFADDYTVPTVIFLWPENEELVPFMTKYLNQLVDTLSSTPNIVLCLEKQPQSRMGQLKYDMLINDFSRYVSVCYLDYMQICIGIKNYTSPKRTDKPYFELPVRELFEGLIITETDATWLKEDLDVLFLNTKYIPSDTEIEKDVMNFSKGGTLSWYTLYSDCAEHTITDRDVSIELEEMIGRHLLGYKTVIITLCHAPGSGGTTLAQKTLWNFHRKYPCLQLKLRTTSSIDEINRKISFLHKVTDLPVLLLIDGDEESKVRSLSRRLKYVVILHVKRYTYRISNTCSNDRVYLSGLVSLTESRGLEAKFGEKCESETKRKRLAALTSDVQYKRSFHYVYEYGMTVYLHEFKGIVSYVEGYLELNKNITNELTPSQKCLGYLALVYYYGQACLPCQFFSALFKKPSNFIMTLEDFPCPIQEFVVYDKNDGRWNNIRISHFIVAKEILEQILSRSVGRSKELSDSLGLRACRNLSQFCMEFIEYAGYKKTKVATSSTTIKFILTKTFIFRDGKEMSDNEEQVRRRPVLSRLMIDIPAGKPLFTERFNVLKKLTESFPDDPNFCAHLGRFHAFCRPDEEKEAEKCFQKALNLCHEHSKGKREEDIDEGLKLTMTHIYHMYGIVKQRYVSKFTGHFQKEQANSNDELTFHERIEELIPIAFTACDYFKKSRDLTPDNHEVYTYAYTGEIQLRLQICDYVNRNFKTETSKSRIAEFLTSNADQESKNFVETSIFEIENLILECFVDVDLMGDDVKSLRRYVEWYNGLFKEQVIPLESINSGDGVSSRRNKIAVKKLKCGKMNNFNGIESIDNEKDLNEIVQLYEENFNDIEHTEFTNGKLDLERDYREWIYAIRHEKFKKEYSVEDVLTHVQCWHATTRSPTSTFYMFIMHSLLGFGTEKTPGKTECLIEAQNCKEILTKMNHLVIRPKYPREWLGNEGEGIKRLLSGYRHVGICPVERNMEYNRSDRAICKGTICRPNTNKVNGMISLDLGENTRTAEVKVYFIPQKVNLEGKRYAGIRVEFNLAFTYQHGYEAYNVKLLKRYTCGKCSHTIEFTSEDIYQVCKCGFCVQRDHLNAVAF